MAIRFYDEALGEKIAKWDNDNHLHILKPDEVTRLFKIKADEHNDKPIELPLVALSRNTDITILNTNKRPLSFDGMRLKFYDKEGKEVIRKSAFQLNAIPIQLEYQLDIYTRELIEADEYLRNFVFNFINYPTLTISIPYNNVKIKHKSTVHLNEVIQDNSDISQRLFPDQFTRYTLTLTIDDAYLFSVPDKQFVSMQCESVVIENEENRIETIEIVD